MHSDGPYSLDLMTRVLLGLGPPTADYTSHEEPVSSLEGEAPWQSLSLAESSAILLDLVDTLERRPAGWLPPLYPSPRPYLNRNLPPEHIPTTSDPLEFDTSSSRYPGVRRGSVHSTNSESGGSTPTSPVSTRTSSSFVPTQELDAEPVRGAKDENDLLGPSPLRVLREKDRKKIRQGSGVKSKAKTPRTDSARDIGATPHSDSPLEMVQCQWEGCTEQLYVDYINVRHWAKHIREHYADEHDTIQCKWKGGCGFAINKSSMWKHIVVHQPKFKIRCPRGCNVSTRSDMMRRHLRTCNYTSARAAKKGESGREENVEVEQGSYGGDCDSDGEGNEESRED